MEELRLEVELVMEHNIVGWPHRGNVIIEAKVSHLIPICNVRKIGPGCHLVKLLNNCRTEGHPHSAHICMEGMGLLILIVISKNAIVEIG